MIQISQAAAREIKRLKKIREGLTPPRQQPDNLFRLSVQDGGCSGLFYNLKLDNVRPQQHSQAETLDGDRLWESNGLTVIVDEQTCAYVQGLKLDYSEDLMGGGFRFQNPNADSTCKCGLSFEIKKIQEQED